MLETHTYTLTHTHITIQKHQLSQQLSKQNYTSGTEEAGMAIKYLMEHRVGQKYSSWFIQAAVSRTARRTKTKDFCFSVCQQFGNVDLFLIIIFP